MNIIDYIVIVLLLLFALKGFKAGLLPTIVSLISTFLVFIIAFYLKGPISVLLYENLPFLNFAGIFKGVIAVNILFYEAIAYGITILILDIILALLKRFSTGLQKVLNITIFLNLPSKILGAIIGVAEGILFCFLLLFIASVVNTTTTYVNESKYGSIVLKNIPILSDVTSNLTNSTKEVYNIVLKNENDTKTANLETVDVLMKYNILNYDSAIKLVESNKLNIEGVEEIINKYKGE